MNPPHPSTAITIGSFDGVHRGHAALIARCRAEVGPTGRVVAMAFDPHPASRLRPEAVPARLTTFDRRAELLRGLGADEVVRLAPDDALLHLSADAFVNRMHQQFRPTAWVEGADFHFGQGRAGNIGTLASLGPALGFRAITVPGVNLALDDHLVARASSTLVRWLLRHGRARDAAAVLGRWYDYTGVVTRGDQRGRTIGFPTLNVVSECTPPGDGVYAAWATLPDGRRLPAAVNVGVRPTFNGRERRVEACVLSGHDRPSPASLAGLPDYGWQVSIEFVAWVRDQVRFDGVAALTAQLARDASTAARLAGDAG